MGWHAASEVMAGFLEQADVLVVEMQGNGAPAARTSALTLTETPANCPLVAEVFCCWPPVVRNFEVAQPGHFQGNYTCSCTFIVN